MVIFDGLDEDRWHHGTNGMELFRSCDGGNFLPHTPSILVLVVGSRVVDELNISMP